MISRCTKNKIRAAALEYFREEITQYISYKEAIVKEPENKDVQQKLDALDDSLAAKAFFYTIASECVLEGVDNGFEQLEAYYKEQKEEQDDG